MKLFKGHFSDLHTKIGYADGLCLRRWATIEQENH